ncbi:MAG: glycosyltransferase [Saprospiraceae bacterium]
MQETTKLDIVLPCYNPLPDWEKRIINAMNTLKSALPDVELYLYIVNDGSSQKVEPTLIWALKDVIRNFQFIEYKKNRGKGYALRQGVAETKNDLCIYTDIDFPYEMESFLRIYEDLKKGSDVSIGVRSEVYYESVPKVRIWISKTLKFFVRNLLSLPVTDTQCGLKGFNKKGKVLFLQTTIDRYLFDLEFVFNTAKQKALKLHPVTVELRPGIVFTNMNFKVLFQEGRSFLKIFFKSLFSKN